MMRYTFDVQVLAEYLLQQWFFFVASYSSDELINPN